MDEHKCVYCPYYTQTTSYGTEWVKCANADCIHYEEVTTDDE